MSAKKATQKSAKSTTAIDKTSKRFTDVTGAASPSAADPPRRAGELVAAQFDTVAAAAEGCDALVATGVMSAGVWL